MSPRSEVVGSMSGWKPWVKLHAVRLTTKLMLAVGLAACYASEPSGGGYVRVTSEWVTGAAAAALGPDGRFDFPDPLPPEPGELSREESLALARAYIRTVPFLVGNLRSSIEEEHGAPIDWAHLAPGGRRIVPYFTNLSDPGAAVPAFVRTAFGPSYLIEFCSASGVPSVEVEVRVRTLARVGPDG